jgi:hypothetical protein
MRMLCEHTNAKAVEPGVFWCLDCGRHIDFEGNDVEGYVPTTNEPKKRRGRPRKNPGNMPMAPLPQTMVSEASERKEAEILPPGTPPSVEPNPRTKATTKGSTTQDYGVKGYTSVDADMPLGPWEGIPCANRDRGCHGLIRTYRTITTAKLGNAYMMKCPECGVQLNLSFYDAKLKA